MGIEIAALAASAQAFFSTAVIGSVTVGQITFTAATFGASLLANQLGQKNQRPSSQQNDAKQTVRGALTPRRVVIGSTMVSNIPGYVQATDATGSVLGQVHLFCQGPIVYDGLYYGDREVTIDGTFAVIAPSDLRWQQAGTSVPALSVQRMTGEPDQVSNLILPAYFADWTADHRLRGIAHIATAGLSTSANDFSRIYPNGANPLWRAAVQGTSLWDPRVSATPAADTRVGNPALAALFVYLSPDFYGLDESELNIASFIAAANACDTPRIDHDGVSRPMWRFDGILSMADENRETLNRILVTAGLTVTQGSDGRIRMDGGRYQIPAVTITADDVSSYEFDLGPDIFKAINTVQPIYTPPETRYTEVEAAPVYDGARVWLLQGEVKETLKLDEVKSHRQARDLAWLALQRANAKFKGSVKGGLSLLKVWDEPTVVLDIPGYQGVYRITERTISGFPFEVSISLEWEQEDFWPAASPLEVVAPRPLPVDTTNPLLPPPVVQGVGVAIGDGTANVTLNIAVLDSMKLHRTAIFYRRVGAADWSQLNLSPGQTGFSFTEIGLPDANVDFETYGVLHSEPNGFTGDSTAPTVFTIPRNPAPPPVTGLSQIPGLAQWIAPTTDDRYHLTEIRRPDGTLLATRSGGNPQSWSGSGAIVVRTINSDGGYRVGADQTITVS